MNTKTEIQVVYENQKIFGNGCYPNGIFNNRGEITVIAQRGTSCSGGLSVLDESTNTWTPQYFQISNPNDYI